MTTSRVSVQNYNYTNMPTNWECEICLDGPTTDKVIGHKASNTREGDISHIFHEKCLKEWLSKKLKLPLAVAHRFRHECKSG